MRFVAAGLALCGWTLARHEPMPSSPQWRSAFVLAFLIFVLDYGVLYWAEQRVPSGIAAVILATIPVSITLLEIIFLRTQQLTLRLSAGLAIGILGVGVLVNPWSSMGEALLDRGGVIALIVACWGWSISLPTPS